VLGRVVIERQQLANVIGDFRSGLGELCPIGGIEGLNRGPGVVFVLGAPDPGQGLLRARVG
jgi:hypothetical protein